MAKAVLLAVVLMQCCNAILAARPLLDAAAAAAGGDGEWLGMIMQVLDKGGPSGPGGGNPCCNQSPGGGR
ncbi:hypothetical protein PVAP13_9KG601600 [Panicum virgatum]|uniref:Uncharacterized protein n=1 Tax=Panicum virgatum TaxID=38727 RepID=A0A8T0P1I8_PANVG|nr:hypothetical protein PVAP13_9KG601600 [Panicum virgatum]